MMFDLLEGSLRSCGNAGCGCFVILIGLLLLWGIFMVVIGF